MGIRQQIGAAIGGTISTRFPSTPSSVVVTIYDPRGREVVAETAAIAPATTWSISGWDSDDPTILPVPSLALPIPTPRRSYRLLYSAGNETPGAAPWVQVVGVDTIAKKIIIADPLERPIASTAILLDTYASYTVTANQLPYGCLYRADFRASNGLRQEVFFDVVHTPAWNPATAAGFREFRPFLADEWQTTYSTGHTYDDMLRSSYEGVLLDLEASVTQRGNDLVYGIVDWGQLERVVYHRLLWDQAHSMIPKEYTQTPDLYRDSVMQDYQRILRSFQASIRYVDPDQTRAETQERRYPIKRITI